MALGQGGYADSVLSHRGWGGVLCDKKNQLVPSTNLGVGVYICKIKVGTLTNYEGYLIEL